MKKSLFVVLCLMITLFMFASCNGDTKAPGTDVDNGSTPDPETPSTEIIGKWISEDEDGHTEYLTFGVDGVVKYQNLYADELQNEFVEDYIMEGNLCYLTSYTDVIGKIDYSLDETAHTFTEIISPTHSDVYTAEGETNGIIGTWIRKTENFTYSYTITDKNIRYQCRGKDHLFDENNYTYTDNGNNTLELKYIDSKYYLGSYDETSDTFSVDGGSNYIREK